MRNEPKEVSNIRDWRADLPKPGKEIAVPKPVDPARVDRVPGQTAFTVDDGNFSRVSHDLGFPNQKSEVSNRK